MSFSDDTYGWYQGSRRQTILLQPRTAQEAVQLRAHTCVVLHESSTESYTWCHFLTGKNTIDNHSCCTGKYVSFSLWLPFWLVYNTSIHLVKRTSPICVTRARVCLVEGEGTNWDLRCQTMDHNDITRQTGLLAHQRGNKTKHSAPQSNCLLQQKRLSNTEESQISRER